jgi:diguanylate cyclase (GGDEF)-like protein
MDKRLDRKISALDPAFREKLKDLFEAITESISELYETAIMDEKTGLYNNKFFEASLGIEIEKAKRGYDNLSLAIIDIDHFNKKNDSLGHMKADELLLRLASLIKKKIRKYDIAARFGGEEFFVLLPETSLEKARKFASRLRNAIHSDKILKKHNVNVSGGITQFRKGDTKKRFKERADKALYKAKVQGRDRFISME